MNKKYIAVLAFLALGTVASFSYQNFLGNEVQESLKEGMQRDINRAITDLFIMKGEVYPSINMFYKFAGKSALFLNAHYAKNRGNYQEAGDFLRLLSDKENSAEILKQTYLSLALAGRVDEAVEYAEKAKNAGSDDIVTELVIISDAAKKGDFAKMHEIIDKSAQVKYNEGLIALLKAWAYAGEKKYDEALKTLEKIKNNKAFAGPYAFHKALLQDMAGKNKEAAKSYLSILGDNGQDASIRSLQAAISFFRRTGDIKKAEELLEIYKKNPAHFAYVGESFFWPEKDEQPVKNAASGVAESILGIATSYVTGSDVGVGILFLRITLFLDESLVPAKVLLAEALEKVELYDEAVKVYSSLQKGSNLYTSSQIQMIKLLLEQKKFEQARDILSDMKKQYKDDMSLFVMEGDINKAEGKFEEAINNYTQAIQSAPDESKVPSALYATRGMILAEVGRWSQAEGDLLKSLAKNPSNPLVLNYLGYNWLVMGKNTEQAKKMIIMAAQQAPEDGYIIDSLGWMYYLSGDMVNAVEFLEKSLQLIPSNSIVNDHLGDVYWKLGRKREAVFQWEKAVKLNQGINPEVIEDIKFKIEHGLDVFLRRQETKEQDKKG